MESLLKKKIAMPTSVCQYVIQERIVAAFRVYVYAKYISKDGKLSLAYGQRTLICNVLNISAPETLRNAIKTLEKYGWARYDNKSDLLFLRSIKKIQRDLNFDFTTHAVFYEDQLVTKEKFKAYLIGAVFTQFITSLRGREKKDGGKIARAPMQLSDPCLALYKPVPLQTIRNLFKVNEKTAIGYKELAKKHNYIDVKEQYVTADVSNHIDLYKKYGDTKEARKIHFRDDRWCYRNPDLIYGRVQLSNKKLKEK